MATEITITLTEEMQRALREIEKRYHNAGLPPPDSQDQLIARALQDLITRLDDDLLDETEDEILDGFRAGWHEAMTGQTRSLDAFLQESWCTIKP